MIILLAAMFSLVRLTRQNELTAIISSGISLKRVIAPVVLIGVLLNLLMVLDQELILPRFADKLVRNHDEVAQLEMMPVWLQPDQDGALVSAKLNPQENRLSEVWILLRQERQAFAWITADSAEWDDSLQRYQLSNGQYHVVAAGNTSTRETKKTITTYPRKT